MILIAQENLAVHLNETSLQGSCPLACIRGIGTPASPLRMSLLLRHADMADETTFDLAYSKAKKTLEALDNGLSTAHIEEHSPSESESASQLIRVIEAANPVAQADTYYSVAIVVVLGKRIVVASIGDVQVEVMHKDDRRIVIQPSILSNEESFGIQSNILTGALGIGFSRDKIRTYSSRLNPNEIAVLGMQVDLLQEPGYLGFYDSETMQSPEGTLKQVLNKLKIEPPLMAVITYLE